MFKNEKIAHSRGRLGQHGGYLSDYTSRVHAQVMMRPQTPPETVRPHITDIGMMPQMFSPPAASKQVRGDMLRTKISCFEQKNWQIKFHQDFELGVSTAP